jgi:hypothetical protein
MKSQEYSSSFLQILDKPLPRALLIADSKLDIDSNQDRIEETKLRASATHLTSKGGKNALSMDKGRVAQIVQAISVEDLGTSLEPDRLLDGNT